MWEQNGPVTPSRYHGRIAALTDEDKF